MPEKESTKKCVTNGRKLCLCGMTFARSSTCINHIITVHNSCPWCESLPFLQGSDAPISFDERIDHIASCAKKKRTSLYRCLVCGKIFHTFTREHKCGIACLMNIGFVDKNKNVNSIKKVKCDIKKNEQMRCCTLCCQMLCSVSACKMHIIRRHKQCAWCEQPLDVNNKKNTQDHLMACAFNNGESVWVCNICFGVATRKSSVHASINCNGVPNLFSYDYQNISHNAEIGSFDDELLEVLSFDKNNDNFECDEWW